MIKNKKTLDNVAEKNIAGVISTGSLRIYVLINK
jgi:hypothetical protein